MRFSNLILGLSALVVYGKASEGSSNGKTVETDVVDGEKIKLTAADVANIKTILTDDQQAIESLGGDPSWTSKDDVLKFAHAAVIEGIYPDIHVALADGVKQMNEVVAGISQVEYLSNRDDADDLFGFSDYDYDDDIEPDAMAALDDFFVVDNSDARRTA